MLKSYKSEIIKRIKSDLDTYQAVVACSVSSVRADTMNDIRKQCFDQNSKVMVTKYSLFKIAAQDSQFVDMTGYLAGESMAMVYGNDILGMVKLLSKIAKKEEKWNLKFGFATPNQYFTVQDLEVMSKLPPLEVLRSQLIGRIQGVMQKILFVTKEPMRKIVYLLNEKSKK